MSGQGERSDIETLKAAIRALVVDIDGTLTDEHYLISFDAVEGLQEAQRRGLTVMLASGNVLPVAFGLSRYFGLQGPIIAENGGIVSWKERIERLGKREKPEEALAYLQGQMRVERLFTDRWRETEVAVKIAADVERMKELLRGWDLQIESTGFAHHIMDGELNKLPALRVAAEWLGIPLEQIAAIGDSDNDAKMVGAVGVGICVANGSEACKAAAAHVTHEPNGAGVLEALHWLGLLP